MANKIMFNDKYEITAAVLQGRKTQTRRNSCRYKVGEVVAIAQAYKDIASERDDALNVLDLYKIGNSLLTIDEMGAGWNNKMFVRAGLMPHHIRITSMHQERLQDISDEDCLKEGIIAELDPLENGRPAYDYTYDYNHYFDTPREAYASLIDRLNGKGTWASNPMIWVYDFELLD